MYTILFLIFIQQFTFPADPDAQVPNKTFLFNKGTEIKNGGGQIRRCNSDSACELRVKGKKFFSSALKAVVSEKGVTSCSNSPPLICVYDDLLKIIFEVENHKKKEGEEKIKELLCCAQKCLGRLDKKIKKTNNDSTLGCYGNRLKRCSRILSLGEGEYEVSCFDQDWFDLACDGLQLVKKLNEEAQESDVEHGMDLYNRIEEILEISGSIFERKADREKRSLEWLERTLKLIRSTRSHQKKLLPTLITVARVNDFSEVVKKAKEKEIKKE